MSPTSRREFLGAVVSTALVGGCRGENRKPKSHKPDKPDKQEEQDDPVGEPQPREAVMPPVETPSKDTLKVIRQVKPPGAEMVVLAGTEPADMVRKGLEAIGGGISLFISRGDTVLLTPNYGLARPMGTGVATSPELVREVIKQCWKAGAQEVICLDHTYSPTPHAFRINGAYKAIQGTGASLLSPWSAEQYICVKDFDRMELHRTKLKWQAVPRVLLRCNVMISVPIFKHHRDAMMSGAIKKMMGCIWRRASYHHVDLHGCIAELGTVMRPTLTIMDAGKILVTNGPDGPGKLSTINRVLVSLDPVLADAYACRWLDLEPESVGYLKQAAKLGAGSLDVDKAQIEMVKV